MSRRHKVVPNFVGGPLPRSDKGDREYYCCTMLTLFKPWRSVADLKTNDQKWDTAFQEYEFGTRHSEIIRNFNLRYECLDAKDDYKSEQRRKETDQYGASQTDGEGGENAVEYDDFDFVRVVDDDVDYDVPGNAYRHELECKRGADAVMREAGWLSKNVDVVRHGMSRFVPEHAKSHSEWAAIVKGERARLFKSKLSGYVPTLSSTTDSRAFGSWTDHVGVRSADYLLSSYRPRRAEEASATDQIAQQFSLNSEQERAYRIIANHASSLAPEQLKMYLGGMGGTGKSQVIKAVMCLFRQRGESHRFIILGPTGTSAALLNGSTYHSALGIRSRSEKGADYSRNEGAAINEVRSRLQGVQYIFIDEISMVSCRDLYSISQRLSQVFNNDTVFGGVNMILAGDFAQLPPVGNLPLYSPLVSCVQSSGMRPSDQEAMLGKVFWHQFTTVVVLKQNMRQRSQTVEDAMLRTALENMRYAACTQDDVEFLNSRTADQLKLDGKPILVHPNFRNVSVITAWNNQKDRFNEQGAARFAADNGQELYSFYSVDNLSSQDKEAKGRSRRPKAVAGFKKPRRMSDRLQSALWGCSPCASEHVASKLSVCVGMPVLIRNNDATELCITKGQEALVVGWDSSVGPMGRPVLNTLFVKLLSPPQTVTIPGLPPDVVPIPRASTKVICTLKSGVKVTVQRQQVLVLPNFAMTDYSSQGKTRPFNVVHLEHCKDHMSYYTCLSRSASAAGTVLMQRVDAFKICKGISGHLRQEFRELNVLDKVTELKYNGELPDNVLQPLRNITVRNYMLWASGSPCDVDWHDSIAYDEGESRIKPLGSDALWDVNYLASRTKITKSAKKRKRDASGCEAYPIRNVRPNLESVIENPVGFKWDSSNYSCAYDSVFTVLYNVWRTNRRMWGRRFADVGDFMDMMSKEFGRCEDQDRPIEEARDAIRRALTVSDPDSFPVGSTYTYIYKLVSAMTGRKRCGTSRASCGACGYVAISSGLNIGELVSLMDASTDDSSGHVSGGSACLTSVSIALNASIISGRCAARASCPRCRSVGIENAMELTATIDRMPYIMWVEMSAPEYYIDTAFGYDDISAEIKYTLAGVVYGGQGHFVSRVVGADGSVWFNDGMTTGSSCTMEFTIDTAMDATDMLRYVDVSGRRKDALYAVYVRC